MITPRGLFTLLFTIWSGGCFAQQSGEYITLPYETLFEIKGIKAKLILESISSTPAGGSIVELTLGFQNPLNSQWVYFEDDSVSMSNKDGLYPPFNFKLRMGFENSEINFLREILAPSEGRLFIWKCGCQESLPKLPI